VHHAERPADEPWHRPSPPVADDSRPDEPHPPSAAGLELDPSRGERIPDPLGVRPVGQGERDGPSVPAREGHHRRAVETARSTAAMDDPAEPGQMPDQGAQDAVGEALVEAGDAASERDRHSVTVSRSPGAVAAPVGFAMMNIVDVLGYGHRDIERLLARVQPHQWKLLALGVWTTKDLVGHLGAFEVRFADVLAGFAGEAPQSDLTAADPATFNDEQAAVRRDWPVEAILTELRDANGRVMRLARSISSETWTRVGAIPWYGPEYALDDLAVYSMYGHKREHAPQIEAVLER